LDGEIISQLLIYTEEDGNIYFSCDWMDSEDAKTSIATILYRLGEGELVDEIISNLSSQCVLKDREEDFEKILTLYHSLNMLKKSVNELSRDEPVINPLDATTF
tara:strand:+ start:352 stop:663 length:312 start_codon:yes stop_codon:yes gene_type:complete